MLIPILFSAIYLLACFGVASIAKNRKVGSQKTFHLAVLFTPLVALIVVTFSSKEQIHVLQSFHCKRCGLEFSERNGSCPDCAKGEVNMLVRESLKQEVS